jgi:serine/threonine protein kinase
MARSKGITFETAFGTYASAGIVGEGGTARVYRAQDTGGQGWAVKVLDPKKASADKLKRFRNEYAFCSNHPHRNIVAVVDHGVTVVDGAKSPFFVMPLFDGSLRTVLANGVQAQKVLALFAQILDGVEAAHLLRVVHRDLKPENCLYSAKDSTLVVADFGVAQFTAEELYTLVETGPYARLANFQYAAPEQRSRGAAVDHRADIYSLGLMLNELFTGRIPHGTDYKTIGAVAPDYAYLDDLVAEMLRQDPSGRPPTIEHVKNQLIARGSVFVEKQRLDSLRRTVVSTKEVTDPLISDPPQLVGAQWDGANLTLTLSQSVNPRWVWALQNMGSYSSVWGKDPASFRISGKEAVVAAEAREVQQIIDHFKNWLPQANSVYAEKIRDDARRAEEEERRRLRSQVAAAELRARVNETIRI